MAEREMVFAAGGLLWRKRGDERVTDAIDATDGGDAIDAGDDGDGDECRLAVVHRPRYDDWSLPKGKVEPGELLPETAVREVREETGISVDRGAFAGRYQYDVAAGPKSVFVWHMRAVDDVSAPDDEVDALAWLPVDAALDRLTYDLERELVGRVGSPSSVDFGPWCRPSRRR
ncbi:NUDIX hydrolase [Salinigranum marinum]|uniref:NUDIX hydrolase n=1 Tax=Salinigranum marinum TaxID=1515595 RepID=UPI002989D790|nr:NUDIX hydrolase [Salinigranum marinum]